MWLLILLKVTKNQAFTLSLEDKFFEKPQGGSSNWPSPSRFRVKDQIWNLYLTLSWMDIQKKYFWGHKCFGTYTARVVSKQIWVWNWARKNMPVSQIGSSIRIFRDINDIYSCEKLFSKISKVMRWGLTVNLLKLQLSWGTIAKLVTIAKREHRNTYLSQKKISCSSLI